MAESPVTLAVPRDGRIDGYAGTVLGTATGPTLGAYRATPGQSLWAFGSRWGRNNLATDQISVTTIADGIRTPSRSPAGPGLSATAARSIGSPPSSHLPPEVSIEVDSRVGSLSLNPPLGCWGE